MAWYLEHAPDVFVRNGGFFPADEVLKRTGFRSVYALNESDAMELRRCGSSKNVSRYNVYSDELIMDFDNGVDDHFKKAVKWAKDHDCTFTVYESGSKGLHVEIAALPKYGNNVPDSQRRFIQEVIKIDCDASIYRHGSLYRLPGTLHKKTGNPKKLIESHLGQALVDYKLVGNRVTFDFNPVSCHDEVEMALFRVFRFIGCPPSRGMRYQTLWQVAKQLQEAGFSRSTTEELLTKVNCSWHSEAKEVSEITRALNEVYRVSSRN